MLALHRARQCAWVDFTGKAVDFDRCIDMPEHIHYDSLANGALHVLVPGKLIAFPCPANLPGDEVWADAGGARQFSPAYFGDVLGDFGVEIVLRCGVLCYDTWAFEQHGISVENLPVSGHDDADDLADVAAVAGMLSAADRFLTLTDLAQGAIAVHGCGDDGSLGAGGRLLVQMYLMRRHGFGAGDAAAWILMAHPGAAGRAADVVAAEEDAKPELISSAASGSTTLSGWEVLGVCGVPKAAPAPIAAGLDRPASGLAPWVRSNSCGECLALLASGLSPVGLRAASQPCPLATFGGLIASSYSKDNTRHRCQREGILQTHCTTGRLACLNERYL